MTDTVPVADPPRVLPYDPFDPAFHSDPYPAYAKLRETGNIIPTDAGVALLGYQDIVGVLRDPRFGRGDGAGVQDTMIPTSEGLKRAVMFMDPPDHTRIRALITKTFTPRVVDRVRPTAERLTAELVGKAREMSSGAPVDLTAVVFRRLAAGVLNYLVGVPERYLDQCIEFANDAGRGLDPAYTLSPEALAGRLTARDGYVEIAMELLRDRRLEPQDDLVSELVAVEQDGQRLSEIELLTTVANIFLAGFSAPQAAMGLAALALLRHPAQRDWYRDHPEAALTSVEEIIRYDASVQLINRAVLEDAEIGGVPVKAGAEVFMLLGAANRDPSEFVDAESLDLRRTNVRNLGFGHGIHFCIAAPIARLLIEVTLNALVRENIELVTETPQTNGAIAIRSLAELPVVFHS
jgi:cytochrome P450